jgi:predicted O-methyltransferase YrrM
MIAQGAPLARIVTLNPRQGEIELAQKNLRPWTNVKVVVMYSWDYLARTPDGNLLDMVFVDGDHNAIARDLPWFNRLVAGGLFLCHDYTPIGSKQPSPIVYAELDRLAERLGRPFDVSLIDDGRVGMVGFYRRDGETI